MRKQLRPRGQLARRTFGAPAPRRRQQPLAQMIAGLNAGTLTAAPPRPAPEGADLREHAARRRADSYPAWLRWLARAPPAGCCCSRLLFVVLCSSRRPRSSRRSSRWRRSCAAVVALRRGSGRWRSAIETVEAFQPAALTPEAIAALPPNDAFVLPDAMARPRRRRRAAGLTRRKARRSGWPRCNSHAPGRSAGAARRAPAAGAGVRPRHHAAGAPAGAGVRGTALATGCRSRQESFAQLHRRAITTRSRRRRSRASCR